MRTYRVQKGDMRGKMARRFYGDASKFPLIVAANAIGNPDKLSPGQPLIIPNGTPAPPTSPTAPDAPPVAPTTDRTRQLSEGRLSEVHPIATRGRSLIDLCAHGGDTIMVTQGLRTGKNRMRSTPRVVPRRPWGSSTSSRWRRAGRATTTSG